MDINELKDEIERYLGTLDDGCRDENNNSDQESAREWMGAFVSWLEHEAIRRRCGHTILHAEVRSDWIDGVKMAHLTLFCMDCDEPFIWKGKDTVSQDRRTLHVPIAPVHA